MATGDRVAALLGELEKLGRPGLAKTRPSQRDIFKARAAEAFDSIETGEELSQRELARQAGVDERTLRDWRTGARTVPLWAVFALPRDERLAVVRAVVRTLTVDELERDTG